MGVRLVKISSTPIFGRASRSQFWVRFPCQAIAYFQWVNAVSAAAPSHRPPLLINMDETALVRHATGLVGTVQKKAMQKDNVGDVASLGERRSYMTFLASITHDAEVQPRLPQVVIGNERQISVAVARNLPALPENIHIWRCKSAWHSHTLMTKYLSLLASSLGSVLTDRYVILILDVARCHIHPTILAHATHCGIRLCYIPASMTAELQPCDTHLFSRFKAAFKEAWRREKALSPGGSVTALQWIHVVVVAIEAVLPTTDWEAAFAAVGALAEQTCLGQRLSTALGWSNVPTVPEGFPSLQAACLIFPRNMKVNVEAYVGCSSASSVCGLATVQKRRRRLPESFVGTMDRPLTVD